MGQRGLDQITETSSELIRIRRVRRKSLTLLVLAALRLCAGDAGPAGGHRPEGVSAPGEDRPQRPHCDHMIPPHLTAFTQPSDSAPAPPRTAVGRVKLPSNAVLASVSRLAWRQSCTKTDTLLAVLPEELLI